MEPPYLDDPVDPEEIREYDRTQRKLLEDLHHEYVAALDRDAPADQINDIKDDYEEIRIELYGLHNYM